MNTGGLAASPEREAAPRPYRSGSRAPLYYGAEYPIRDESGRQWARVWVEIASAVDDPVTRAMVRHIDAVRLMLVTGRMTVDDAHASLVSTRWLGRAVATAVVRGMRACAGG